MRALLITLGVLGAGLIGLGIYEERKAKAQASSSGPAYSGGGSIDIVLAPGNMSIGLSLTGDNQATFTLPTGAKGSIYLLSADATTVKTSGMTMTPPATATAVKVGSTTLQAAWTDAQGVNQSTTIAVNVQA